MIACVRPKASRLRRPWVASVRCATDEKSDARVTASDGAHQRQQDGLRLLTAAAAGRVLRVKIVGAARLRIEQAIHDTVQQNGGAVVALRCAPSVHGLVGCELRFVAHSALEAGAALLGLSRLGAIGFDPIRARKV